MNFDDKVLLVINSIRFGKGYNMRKIGKKASMVIVFLLVIALLPVSGYRMTEAKTKVSVKSIVFTKDIGKTLDLFVGQTYQLQTKLTPSNASNKKVTYESSDSKIVTVNSSGLLKALKKGTVKITVMAKDGSGKKAVLTVHSKVWVSKVTIIEPVDQNLVLTKGKTFTIKTKVTPANASNKALSFSSSNSKVLTVSSTGKVTVKSSGKATIIVKAKDGSGKVDILRVIVINPVTSITLAESTVTKEVGSDYQMSATVLPSDATNKKLAYRSSDTNLAAVDESGKVSLKKEGTVTITAASTDGTDIKAAVTITIAPAKPVITIPIISPPIPSDTPAQNDSYKLVWQDDFSGDTLNTADWNYELHEPGWVNNELQQYTNSIDNIFVSDGNLVIKAMKTEDENGTTYTSGRVNTQGKHDFKYGRFEIRAKMTKGQGFLPAIWMMPTNENIYGQWPKCGEIDISEVLGNQTNKTYGTLHFGEPHTQKQGSYTLANGDYSNGYHVYSAEWEPSEIRFYVDGILYNTVNDWFTKNAGFKEATYPAPFDQPFYLILNLAVGGNWPGNPDQTTQFDENSELKIDYVKVYQKDSYDENVQKPSSDITFRDPDATGNYINNGDFSVNENLADSNDWGFLLAGTGAATADITGNELHINTTNAGNLNYSVQFVQPNLPMEKGYRYRLTFDASAAADRTMIVDISAPDYGYIRYLADTTINLTTSKQSYSYEFDMLNNSDTNGRVEFNFGNQGSTDRVTISNVRLVKVGPAVIPPEVKSVLPDGNYVYNGEFQEGTNRLGYWDIDNQCNGAQVEVTNINNIHELKATVPSSVTGLNQVAVQQDPIAISGGKTYELSFDAYGDSNQTIQATIAGNQFDAVLTNTKTTYKYSFTTDSGLTAGALKILLGVAGTTCIDNVRIQEDSLLLNGDFSNGFTGYEVFTDGSVSSQVTYVVDGLTENNAAAFDIKDTGDQDWKIQLKQNNIKLENGKWYKITLDAKSSMNRAIMYALQKDGSQDNDWTPYSGTQIINLTNTYNSFSTTFQMTSATDPSTILSISMGSVGGTRITDQHQVYIDNITLEEVEAPPLNPVDEGAELIQNGDFAAAGDHWNIWSITAPGAANVTFLAGKVSYDITNPGNDDWNVQLKQGGLLMENQASYIVTFKVKSTQSRSIKVAFLNASYDWYGGADISLNADEEQTVTQTIVVTKQTDPAIDFVISMGKIGDTPASTIEISNVSLKKIS
ncbi:MAG: hypothetical protein K0S01_252 [Herbinix sp.]|jgi:beta-glucanase (GH16 family)|nr:hypothetical protein [Herbinix sp.]